MGVSVVVEINELPSQTRWLPDAVSRRISHLDSAAGVVAISGWLGDWARDEAARIGREVRVVEIPIVVDIDEFSLLPSPGQRAMFVYSASESYHLAMRFILLAMRHLWERRPDCELAVTGMRPETVARLMREEQAPPTAPVRALGYIGRTSLRDLYAEATGLLIPLPDDLRSRARFPTKLGEYLASGRPVVTTAVGEIERYCTDLETAFVARPDDPGAFADKMQQVLTDPERAERVGSAGRRLAEERFAYVGACAPLWPFLYELCTPLPRAAAEGEGGPTR
jgi:glycosyltransferase involved in cell wall biosynthesis